MSGLSTFNNNHFAHNSFDHSINVQDFIKQNQQLKQSIEQLIQQNTQLTQIIEELSNQKQFPAGDNMANINQEELEALAHQVIELQQELQLQKQISAKNAQSDVGAEQTIKIIQQLSNQFQEMQQQYQAQVQKLRTQKEQCQNTLGSTQTKLTKTVQQYNMLLEKLMKKDHKIAQLQGRLNEINKKWSKISTKIEDPRAALEKQIGEKQNVIKKYEQLVKNLRVKLTEK